MSETKKELEERGAVDPQAAEDKIKVAELTAKMRVLGEKAGPLTDDAVDAFLREHDRSKPSAPEAQREGTPMIDPVKAHEWAERAIEDTRRSQVITAADLQIQVRSDVAISQERVQECEHDWCYNEWQGHDFSVYCRKCNEQRDEMPEKPSSPAEQRETTQDTPWHVVAPYIYDAQNHVVLYIPGASKELLERIVAAVNGEAERKVWKAAAEQNATLYREANARLPRLEAQVEQLERENALLLAGQREPEIRTTTEAS